MKTRPRAPSPCSSPAAASGQGTNQTLLVRFYSSPNPPSFVKTNPTSILLRDQQQENKGWSIPCFLQTANNTEPCFFVCNFQSSPERDRRSKSTSSVKAKSSLCLLRPETLFSNSDKSMWPTRDLLCNLTKINGPPRIKIDPFFFSHSDQLVEPWSSCRPESLDPLSASTSVCLKRVWSSVSNSTTSTVLQT